MSDVPPASPCVNICVLDRHGYCTGCYRTIEEIAGWQSLTAAEQQAVLRRVAERAAKRAAGSK